MPYTSTYVFTKKQHVYMRIKRCMDVVLALILLVLTSPIMLAAMIWIKCETPGPAIFKQRRTGYHQKIFTIYKLRTMITETVRNGRALTNEERNTKSGLFLRRTSIDELPQLINIIKGDMSFIGPRPYLINDLDTYSERQLIRFEVMPGMTSWSAVNGRADKSLQEKYNCEVYYVEHFGFRIDVEIFFRTIAVVISGEGVEDTGVNRIGAEIIDDRERVGER